MSYLKFWEKDKPSYQVSEQEIGQFASKIRVHRNATESHYLLACYYQQRGRHPEAIREFDKAIYNDPGNARAYNGKGVSCDKLKDYARAVKSYEMALKIDPNLDYVHNNLGYSYVLQGNYPAAIASFQASLAINDKNVRTHNNLGLAYAMNGQYDLALQQFEQSGDRARARYNVAGVYYEKGLFDEAKQEYREALNLNPDFPGARNGLEAADALARITRAVAADREEKGAATTPEKSDGTGWSGDPSRREIGIEVSNGNGVNHMAREISQYLKTRGFNVVRLTNADHFNYTEGSILCRRGYCGMAQEIAMWLPNIQHIRETNAFDRESVKIKVVVGKDQIQYRALITARRGDA